jgi:hypothetical protein
MDGIVSELVILMKKSTDLLENMSLQKDPVSSLANKNISNAAQSSTFGKKESSDLTQNETKKVTKVASIFISKFFEEQDRRKKDTFEKTSLVENKPAARGGSSAEKIQKQITPEKAPSGLLDTLLGMLGLSGLFKKLKIGDILKSIKKVIGKITNVIKKVVSRVWGGLKKVISSIGNFFKNAFSKLKNSKIWTSFKDALNKGKDAIKKLLTSAKNMILKALKSVGKFFKNILSKIPGISKLFPSLVASPDAAKKTATSVAKKATTEVATKAIPKQGGFFNAVKSFGSKALSGAKAVGSAAVSGAKAVGSAAVSGVKTTGKALASGAKAVTSFAIEPAKKAISGAVSGAVKTAGGVGKFLKVLKGVPLLGGIIESVLSYNDIQNLKAEYDAGKISIDDLQQRAGKRGIEGVTALIGTTAGGALGAALGSVVPVAGNFIGGLIGAVGGDIAGRFLGGVIADNVLPEKYTKSIGAFFTNTTAPKDEMQDFIIRGKNVYPFSSKDDVMGMKSGGAIENFLGSSGKNDGLRNLTKMIQTSNNYLRAIERNTRNPNTTESKQSPNKNSVTMMSPPPQIQQETPIVQFGNNRGGYADSVYAL